MLGLLFREKFKSGAMIFRYTRPRSMDPQATDSPETIDNSQLPAHLESALTWHELVRCSTAEARELITHDIAESKCVLPMAIHRVGNESFLSLLAGLPVAADLAKELQFISGYPVTIEGCEPELLRRAIISAYLGNSNHLVNSLSKAIADLYPRHLGAGSLAEPNVAPITSRAPIPLLFEAILHRASYLSASDIHLDALAEGIRVRFRVDGVLRDETGFTAAHGVGDEVIRRIKVLSEIKNAPPGIPQEGSFTFRDKEIELHLRVSIIAQAAGCKVVLRVLERNSVKDQNNSQLYSTLGLTAGQEQRIRAILGATAGCILAVGPTGSGKSTLIYTMLEQLNDSARHIVTIEDPVERTISGITQIQVSPTLGFQELLAKVLRQDPDVIVVGEIRDRESAEAALNAGITGHLVISTLHAGNCIEAFIRLLNLGIDNTLLFTTLRLLISQRLVPRACMSCAKKVKIDQAVAGLFKVDQETVVSVPSGCDKCDGSGHLGRIGVFELLPIAEQVKRFALTAGGRGESLLHQMFIEELTDAAREVGYLPLAVRVRELLISGTISPLWALRTVGIAPELLGVAMR